MASTEITFQVHDMQGQAYHVQFAVEAQAAQGTLAIRQEATGTTQKHTLTALQKSQDGNTLQCKVGPATATLTIREAQNPPVLHLQARVFVPVLDEIYTLQQTEQRRLTAWIQTLALGVLG